jgi:hypothetical protein
MRGIIQHNFTTGFGDALNCIYEYFTTCKNLQKKGYEFELYLNLDKNVYFEKDRFFHYFNEDLFRTIFKKITITEDPIRDVNYEDVVRVHSIGIVEPGGHLWDLFLEVGHDVDDINDVRTFSYTVPHYLERMDVFNNEIIKKYNDLKTLYGLTTPYYAIYYRTHDLQDNVESYSQFDDELRTILNDNEKVFVCSNSFKFKEYIKTFNTNNIVCYDIPKEKESGNHYNYNRVFFDNFELLHLRTEYVIYDMLTLSDAAGIDFFTLWGRPSNFMLIPKLKRTKINERIIYFPESI